MLTTKPYKTIGMRYQKGLLDRIQTYKYEY